MLRGRHLLHHWSRTQQIISLSSAEAELNAICKGAQEGLGAKHMSEEFQNVGELTIKTDASAARGGAETRCWESEASQCQAALGARA